MLVNHGPAAQLAAGHALRRGFAGLRGRLATLAGSWLDLRRSRRDLGQLDDRQLRDIGLTRGQAMAESAIPFWKR